MRQPTTRAIPEVILQAVKPIDEIYRPLPGDAPEKRVPPAPPVHRTCAPGLTLVIICVIAATLICLVMPVIVCDSSGRAREGTTEHLIDNLTQAAKSYEFDHDAYPPGDGSGSRELVRCLSQRGPKGVPYFEFIPEMLDKEGNVLHPAWAAEGKVLHYLCPGRHFAGSFDMWAEDRKGNPQGINNWE